MTNPSLNPVEIVSILDNITYNDKKPALSVLLNTDAVKEIRIVFRKGQEMKEHTAGHPIAVEVVDGCIDFGVAGERHVLNRGMLISLDAHIPHDLIAKENSIIRLSLHKAATVKRV